MSKKKGIPNLLKPMPHWGATASGSTDELSLVFFRHNGLSAGWMFGFVEIRPMDNPQKRWGNPNLMSWAVFLCCSFWAVICGRFGFAWMVEQDGWSRCLSAMKAILYEEVCFKSSCIRYYQCLYQQWSLILVCLLLFMSYSGSSQLLLWVTDHPGKSYILHILDPKFQVDWLILINLSDPFRCFVKESLAILKMIPFFSWPVNLPPPNVPSPQKEGLVSWGGVALGGPLRFPCFFVFVSWLFL